MAGWHGTRRRDLLISGATLAIIPGAAHALDPTPAQTAGPFYPEDLPLDPDADLVQVAGRDREASGTVLHLTGRVLDPEGRAIRAAGVEIWQCDAFGHYHHPADRGGRADPDFQGFGMTTSRDDGSYRFRTIAPVPYPGRTPHIHVRVVPRHGGDLITQMYVEGHPLNQRDGLWRRLGADAGLVTVALEPAPDLEPGRKSGAARATFDLVLGRTPEAG